MSKVQKKELKKAAALKYTPGDDAAPVISAVGVGAAAENILRVADENEVPIVEDKTTADILSALSVGDAIPPALYEAVAQILVFVGSIDTDAVNKYR